MRSQYDLVATPPMERYSRFLHDVTLSGEVWGLRSPSGWATCASLDHPGTNSIPFWSSRPFAEQCAIADWGGYTPVSIPLDIFVVRWLTNMHDRSVEVGVNWSPDMSGYVAPAVAVQNELMQWLGLK